MIALVRLHLWAMQTSENFRRLLLGFNKASALVEFSKVEDTGNTRKGFDRLLDGFHGAAVRWRRSEELIASEFNLLDVLRVSDRELVHSSVLAWLLASDIAGPDIHGTHFQGSLGLRLFLEEVGISAKIANERHNYWVRTESSGNESIIDVEVACRGRFLIHIENKIWAGEGDDQTGREWRDIQKRAKELSIPGNHVHGVFLTPDGRIPGDKNFTPISWSRVARVFERFGAMAKPPVLRVFCGHYATALRMSILQSERDNEEQHEEANI